MAGKSKDPAVRAAKLAAAVEEGRSAGSAAGHEPFEPGNELAVTHGANSMAVVRPRAEGLLEAWLADPEFPEHAKAPAHRLTLRDLARTETQVELLLDLCEAEGLEASITEVVDVAERTVSWGGDGEGGGNQRRTGRTSKRMPPAEQLRRFQVHAANLRRELGLTPLSYARLGKDVASTKVDLARIWAEGS